MKLEILTPDRVDSFVKDPTVVGIKYVGPTMDGRVLVVFSHKHDFISVADTVVSPENGRPDGGVSYLVCSGCGQRQ